MKKIMTIDHKNYSEDMPVFERFGVRAMIRRNVQYAMQKNNLGIYKIPGGGIDPGETCAQALCREVLEETGLIVKKGTIKEIGEILELKQDIFQSGQKYICHSLYYSCDVEEFTTSTHLTESEQAQGFELQWVTLEEAIDSNTRLSQDDWIVRDTRFLEWFLQNYHD